MSETGDTRGDPGHLQPSKRLYNGIMPRETGETTNYKSPQDLATCDSYKFRLDIQIAGSPDSLVSIPITPILWRNQSHNSYPTHPTHTGTIHEDFMDFIEVAQRIGINPKRVSSANGGEYASSCPACGGNDRFRTWPEQKQANCTGRYWCRKCLIAGDTIQLAKDYLHMSYPEAYEFVNGAPLNSTGISSSKKLYLPKKKDQPAKELNLPPEKWRSAATRWVECFNTILMRDNQDILESLHKRGITQEIIDTYKIGFCPQDFRILRQHFGLPEADDGSGKEKRVWLPKGIVIPYLHQGEVIRLIIRRTEWHPNDTVGKYIKVSGNVNGFVIFGNATHKIMAIVESELDALALIGTAGSFLFAVAIGGSTANPDNVTDHLARNRTVLVMHDNDEAGLCMLNKLRSLYPHAHACPVPLDAGKDIGEAITHGLPVRIWIVEELANRSSWSNDDLALIQWLFRLMKHFQKHNDSAFNTNFYQSIEQYIINGPQQPEAQITDLRNQLSELKASVDQHLIL